MTEYRSAAAKRQRTHAKLIETLCLHAAEKPGKSITVRELTERAQVSRGTFYLHFMDIPDMYDKITEQTLGLLSACLDDYLEQYTEDFYTDALARVVDLVDQNRDVFRLLLSSQTHREKIGEALDSVYSTFWRRYGEREIPGKTWDFLITYHTSGILTCIEKWLDGTSGLNKTELMQHLIIVDEGFDEMAEKLRL